MTRVLKVSLVLISTGAVLLGCGGEESKESKDAIVDNYIATTESCECDSTLWFPAAGGVRNTPKPLEGNGSPFDTSSTTNAIFHQWSWQKFLWLTNPLSATDNTPFFLRSLTQVNSFMEKETQRTDAALVLSENLQAGSNGILMSNAAFGTSKKSETVYYSIHVNDKLKSTADLWRSKIESNTDSATNKAVFPVGSLELKVSWIKSSALPASDTSNYYRTMAFIDGSVQEVALLGMHVVGVVKNHPEFIWATFEHHDLAPVYNWKKSTKVKDASVTSSTNRLFFESGAQATASDLTYNPKVPAHAQNVFSVYPFGVPMVAGGHYMKTSQSEPLNYSNIQEINGCVSRHLKDVWNNYFYNGSVWVNTDGLSTQKQIELLVSKGGGLGNSDSTGVTRGSVAAFNITMETYVQLGTSSMHAQNVGNLTNCISCHSAQAKIIVLGDTLKNQRSPLYLSHIFRSSLSLDAGVSKPAIKALRRSEFVELLKK